MILFFIALVIAFFTGFPFGLIVSRAKGIDIKKEGSGNAGATNIWRTFGAQWGILVFFIDTAKAYFIMTVVYEIVAPHALGYFSPVWGIRSPDMLSVFFGGAVILGNVFSPEIFKKKGGKAVATSAGVMLGIYPGIFLIGLGIFGVILLISRMVSAASLIAALAIVILVFFEYGYEPFFYLTVGVVVVIGIRHIPNLDRIIKGKEHKI